MHSGGKEIWEEAIASQIQSYKNPEQFDERFGI